jgi:hypothetical protein
MIWTPLFALACRRVRPGFVMMMFEASDVFPEADQEVPDSTVHFEVSRPPVNSSSNARTDQTPRIPSGTFPGGGGGGGEGGGVYVSVPDRTLPSVAVDLN